MAYFDLLLLVSITLHTLLVHTCHFEEYCAHMLRHIVGLKGTVPSFHEAG
jgi:hypothetical protein